MVVLIVSILLFCCSEWTLFSQNLKQKEYNAEVIWRQADYAEDKSNHSIPFTIGDGNDMIVFKAEKIGIDNKKYYIVAERVEGELFTGDIVSGKLFALNTTQTIKNLTQKSSVGVHILHLVDADNFLPYYP